MTVVRKESNLSADGGDLSLIHARLGHDVGKGATSQVLHHHKKLISDQETEKKKKAHNQRCINCAHKLVFTERLELPVHKVDDVGILHLLHDQDLVADELFLRLLLQVDLLDGHLQHTASH